MKILILAQILVRMKPVWFGVSDGVGWLVGLVGFGFSWVLLSMQLTSSDLLTEMLNSNMNVKKVLQD